jgi:dihydroneopterin aldolase
MTISIRNLTLSMIIGIFEHERKVKQTVHFDIEIELDEQAGLTDYIDNTLDYNQLIEELSAFKKSEYQLLETLIHDMGAFILAKPHVRQVHISADKGKLYENVDKVVVSGVWSNAECGMRS